MRFRPKLKYLLPALLAALLAVFVLTLWIFQAGLAGYLLKKRGGEMVKAGRVEGSVTEGFRLYGVRVRTAGFSAYARVVRIRPDLRGLLRRRPEFSELTITGAVIEPAAGPAGAASKKTGPGLPKDLKIKTIFLEDSRVEFPDGAGGREAVTGISGRLSVAGGQITAEALRGEFRGARFSANGSYGTKGLAVSGDASARRPALLLHFDYALSGGSHALRAEGSLKRALFKLNARLAPGSRWEFELQSSALPLSLARQDLPDFAVPVWVKASGRYFKYGQATGAARFRASLPRAAFLEGGLKVSTGSASLEAALLSPEARGSLECVYSAGELSGAWRVNSEKAVSFPQEKPLTLASFEGKGKIRGRAFSPVLSWDVSAASAAYGAARAELLVSSGEFHSGDSRWFKVTAALENIYFRRKSLGSANFRAEGTPAVNKVEASLTSTWLDTELEGTSEFGNGTWKALWTSFRLRDAPAWRLCWPFSTALSKDRYSLSGFCASDGEARASLSAEASGGALEDLDLALSGFRLESLETLRNLPLPPAGLVSARASWSRGAQYGILEFSGDRLRVKGMDFGSLLVNGRFTRERLEILRADWRVYNGLLSAAGVAALGGREPDLDFFVTISTLNVAPLLVFAPEIKADNVFINGAAELAFKGSAFTNRGVIRVDSPQLEILPLGLKLKQLAVTARGEESAEASITAAAFTKGRGSVTAQGRLGAAGPDLRIKANKLAFDAPQGFSGTASGGLDFKGTWKRPALGGNLVFPEFGFDLPKWRKAPDTGPRSRYYQSLAMDISVKSERNAWYRDPPNSIEMKGSLLMKKAPYTPLVFIGKAEIMKGFYIYLGNNFTLESGTLVFGGETPMNPKLDVSAANAPRESPIKVYLHATGTVLAPKLELTSDPAMEQRDIMSYLLTGKPLYALSGQPGDQASQAGDTGSQVAAANVFATYVSQKTAGPLARRLAIDVINLRMTSDKSADLTVGRYLTNDFYVSYGQVLSPGGEKRVAAEYTITPWWSLEGKNSSQGNYVVDLLFKFGIRSH